MTPNEILRRQDDHITDLTDGLKKDLDRAFKKVLVEVMEKMRSSVDYSAGPTPANRRELRKIANSIQKSADALGVPAILDTFVEGFDETLPYFDQILEMLNSGLGKRLTKKTATDVLVMEGMKASSRDSLGAVIKAMVAQAKKQVLLRVAALNFKSTSQALQKTFGIGVSEAETIAATSLTMYTRINAEQNYRQIEKRIPGGKLYFRYDGPNDKLTRPFCEKLLARTRKEGITRAQIDRLDNGQLPNPFITCGGYNCRHQWVMDMKTTMAKEAKKPASKKKSAPAKPLSVQEKRKNAAKPEQAVKSAKVLKGKPAAPKPTKKASAKMAAKPKTKKRKSKK